MAFHIRAIVASLLLGCLPAFATVAQAAPTTPRYGVVDRIAGPDGGWDFVDVDPVARRLYIAHGTAITAIDLVTRHVTPVLATASGAHQVLVLGGGRELLETDGNTDRARFLDPLTGAQIAEVATGRKPDAAVVDPATGTLLVMNAGDGTVSLIDPVKHVLVGSLDVGGSLEVVAADGHGLVYVNVEDTNEVAIIDVRGRRLAGRYPLPGCDGPTGLAIVAEGARVMSACANRVAVVSDPVTHRVTDRIAIGSGPDGLLYDAKRRVALVPTGEGFLEVIAAARPDAIRKVGRVATHPSARTAVLDPTTGTVYLPSADYLAPVAPAKRGTQVAGSFAVLVVAPRR